jgi:hypothetical protein
MSIPNIVTFNPFLFDYATFNSWTVRKRVALILPLVYIVLSTMMALSNGIKNDPLDAFFYVVFSFVYVFLIYLPCLIMFKYESMMDFFYSITQVTCHSDQILNSGLCYPDFNQTSFCNGECEWASPGVSYNKTCKRGRNTGVQCYLDRGVGQPMITRTVGKFPNLKTRTDCFHSDHPVKEASLCYAYDANSLPSGFSCTGTVCTMSNPPKFTKPAKNLPRYKLFDYFK